MMFRQEVNEDIVSSIVAAKGGGAVGAALVTAASTAVSVGRGFEKISELKDYLLSGIGQSATKNHINLPSFEMLLSYSCRGITDEEISRITERLKSSRLIASEPNRKLPVISSNSEPSLNSQHRWQLQTAELLQDIQIATSRNYNSEIDQIASNISGVVSDRMKGLIRTGIINPVSSAVVSTSLSFVLDKTGLEQTITDYLESKQPTGVSAGDERELGLLELWQEKQDNKKAMGEAQASAKSLDDKTLRDQAEEIMQGKGYIAFGKIVLDDNNKAIVQEYQTRFKDLIVQRQTETVGAALGSVTRVAVEKLSGINFNISDDPESLLERTHNRLNFKSLDLAGSPKKLAEGQKSLSTEKIVARVRSNSNPARNVVIAEPLITRKYIYEIRGITKNAVTQEQVKILKDSLKTQEFRQRRKVSQERLRRAFNNQRESLRTEWEKNTKQEWPRYKQRTGNRKTGEFYDAHHIVPISYGGPNEWWNIHPAHTIEHSKIHSKRSVFREVFSSKNNN